MEYTDFETAARVIAGALGQKFTLWFIYIPDFLFFSVEDGFSEDGWWADATLNAIRKTKSAEHIGIKPTIIVNR